MINKGSYLSSRGDDPCVSLPLIPSRSDDDININPQGIQEPKEPVEREPIELAPHQSRYLGLVDAENRRGLGLSEFAFGDDVADALHEFGLGQQLLGVFQSQVGKDIAATGLNGDFPF